MDLTIENSKHIEEQIAKLFAEWSNEDIVSINYLPRSASYRLYFRISSISMSAIGVFNADIKENNTFITLTKHFLSIGLRVPKVYVIDTSNKFYLLEDLGDTTLFSVLSSKDNLAKKKKALGREVDDEDLLSLYKRIIGSLVDFQMKVSNSFSYFSLQSTFNKRSIMWDLNYFKYCFLKFYRISFDEDCLEDDFRVIVSLLLEVSNDYFVHRDFQSRNIMLYKELPYFIDYQGARRGAIYYDIASLLFDSVARLSYSTRSLLLDYYMGSLSALLNISSKDFRRNYYIYVLFRIMQAFGAYGFRGLFEKKSFFIESIPYAIADISYLLDNVDLFKDDLSKRVPELMFCLESLVLRQQGGK